MTALAASLTDQEMADVAADFVSFGNIVLLAKFYSSLDGLQTTKVE